MLGEMSNHMKAQSVILVVIFENSSKFDMPKSFIQFLDKFILKYHF